MNPMHDDCIENVWNAYQKNDPQAGVRALIATGRDEHQGTVAYNTIKRMAAEARDYSHFAAILKGEAPLSSKLSVQEAASLQGSTTNLTSWTGNGGRTWEGSSR